MTNLSMYETILKRASEDGGVYPWPDTFESDACSTLAKHGLLAQLPDGRQFAATDWGRLAWQTCQEAA